MKSEILNGTCKKCGKPCHERQAFCKKCKPKEVWKSLGFVAGMLFLSSFISALCKSRGLILGAIPSMIIYAPAFISFYTASQKFKPSNAFQEEPTPVEKTNDIEDERSENHKGKRKSEMRKTIIVCVTALCCAAMLSYSFYMSAQEFHNVSAEIREFSASVSTFSETASSDFKAVGQAVSDAIGAAKADTKYHLECVPYGDDSFYIVDLDTGGIYDVTKIPNTAPRTLNDGSTYDLSDGTYRIKVQSRSSFENLGEEDLSSGIDFDAFRERLGIAANH